MNRNYFYIVLAFAIASILLVATSMWHGPEPLKIQEQVLAYPKSPFKSYISGVGVVEAESDDINIATALNRIVKDVAVTVGEKVNKGDLLIKLEDADLQADLKTQKAGYESALAKVKRLEEMPRPEDIMAANAILKSANLDYDDAKIQYERVQGLQDSRALSQEEVSRRKFRYEQAEAKLRQAEADYEKLKRGTWKPDLEIARLEAEQAKALVDRSQAEIERTRITSPIAGTILKVKVHPGEIASLQPLMIIGNTEDVHVRVSINQLQAPYFEKDAPAVGFLQGDSRKEFNLEFVRIEPYLVNKNILTNEINEKVDTKVLPIIYKISNKDNHVYVGQQMDVFIEADYQ